MTGIRVFTSSELRDPTQVSHDQDFNQEPPVNSGKSISLNAGFDRTRVGVIPV